MMREIKGKTFEGMDEEMKGDLRFPNFYIELEHLPEAKGWEVGEEYKITLIVKQTGLSVREHEGKDKEVGNAEFEIRGIESHGKVKAGKKKRYTSDEDDE